MDKIPAEILRKIFLEAVLELYGYLDGTTYPDLDNLDLVTVYIDRPLLLTHVCRFWRETAISFTTLWTYLLIDKYSLLYRKDIKALFDMWLERSKDAPLSYNLSLSNKGGTFEGSGRGETAVYIFKALLSQQHRWRDVRFSWPGSLDSNELKVLPERDFSMTNMPMLNSLSLFCEYPLRVTVDFSQSAKLQKLTMAGNFDVFGGKDALPLLVSKTRLDFNPGTCTENSAHSCLNFLESACALEELHVHFELDDTAFIPGTSKRMVTTTRLRKLKITSVVGQSRIFLDSVTLPSLEVLQLSTRWRDEPVLSFIKRSLPPLTFLSLEMLEEDGSMIEALRLLPTLEDLRLIRSSISTRFFRALMVDVGAETLCPKLHTLYLRGPKFSEEGLVWGHAFLDMLESRQQLMKYFDQVGLSLREDAWADIASLRTLSAEEWKEYASSGRMIVTQYKTLRRPPFTLSPIEEVIASLAGD